MDPQVQKGQSVASELNKKSRSRYFVVNFLNTKKKNENS